MKALFLLFISCSALAEQTTIPVTVKDLSEVLIERKLSANAEVKAINDTQISAEVTAVVKSFHYDLGDVVKKGDLLVSLDATDFELQLQQAKANTAAANARLLQAELRLKRAKELKQSQYISTDDLLARETDVAVLKADLNRIKVSERTSQRLVDKTNITAPFDGIITDRAAQLGQLLVLGSPVLKITQNVDSQIHAKIPAHLAKDLAHADRMTFVVNQQEILVEMIQLSSIIEQQSSVQVARFKPLDEVLVGQTGQLVWYLKGKLLSADLLVKRNGSLGVFINNNNQAEFIPLSHAQEGRPVAIEVQHNWQVIIGGRERLQHGQPIKIK